MVNTLNNKLVKLTIIKQYIWSATYDYVLSSKDAIFNENFAR